MVHPDITRFLRGDDPSSRNSFLGMGWNYHLSDASLVKPLQHTAWQGFESSITIQQQLFSIMIWHDIMYYIQYFLYLISISEHGLILWHINQLHKVRVERYHGTLASLDPGVQWGTLHVRCRGGWLQPNYLAGGVTGLHWLEGWQIWTQN